jgi:uncharacterized protein YqfA (UPF0365 family)
MTTLPDGRDVPDNSELARIDREVRAMHVEQMMRTDTEGRRAYLARVERSEGQASADALRSAFLTVWDERRAQR